MPTQEELRKLFSYDPQTGLLTRRVASRTQPIGTVCGTPHGSAYPYLVIRLDGKNQYLHRLIWIYVHDTMPDKKNIDHINGNPADNRLSNLRLVSQQQNLRNVRIRSDNTSGYPGLFWLKRMNKWLVTIKTLNRRTIYIGSFADKDEAIAARKSAERLYEYHPNHGRKMGQPN